MANRAAGGEQLLQRATPLFGVTPHALTNTFPGGRMPARTPMPLETPKGVPVVMERGVATEDRVARLRQEAYRHLVAGREPRCGFDDAKAMSIRTKSGGSTDGRHPPDDVPRPIIPDGPRHPDRVLVRQPVKAVLREAPTPFADLVPVCARFRGHRTFGGSPARPDNTAAVRQGVRHPPPTDLTLRKRPLHPVRNRGRRRPANTSRPRGLHNHDMTIIPVLPISVLNDCLHRRMPLRPHGSGAMVRA